MKKGVEMLIKRFGLVWVIAIVLGMILIGLSGIAPGLALSWPGEPTPDEVIIRTPAPPLETPTAVQVSPDSLLLTTTEVIVDDLDSGFQLNGPSDGWHHSGSGDTTYNGHAYWTYCTDTWEGSDVNNWATWTPSLPASGQWEVFAYIPYVITGRDDTGQARYQIHTAGGDYIVERNQNDNTGWVSLGTYTFNAGSSGYVRLEDVTPDWYFIYGGQQYRKTIKFDAMKWISTDSGDQDAKFIATVIDAPAVTDILAEVEQVLDEPTGRLRAGDRVWIDAWGYYEPNSRVDWPLQSGDRIEVYGEIGFLDTPDPSGAVAWVGVGPLPHYLEIVEETARVKFRGTVYANEWCSYGEWGNCEVDAVVDEILEDPEGVLEVGAAYCVVYQDSHGFEAGDCIEVYGTPYELVGIVVGGPYGFPGDYIEECEDTACPSIADISESHDPINEQGCPEPTTVTITSLIVDDQSGVDYARLYYRLNYESWADVAMLPNGNAYSATIGPFSEVGGIEYYVKAWDKAGNHCSSSIYGVTVNDCIAPNGLDLSQLEPGDILMVCASPAVDLWVGRFGGYWGHTAIYAGEGEIVESTAYPVPLWCPWPGVRRISIDSEESTFWTASDWVVKRVNTTELWRTVAVLFAEDQIGKPYNWAIQNKWRMDAYYCSQLVWRAYYDCSIDLDSQWSVIRCFEMGHDEDYCNFWADPDAVFPDDIYHDEEHLTEVQAREWDAKRAILYLGSPADFYITDPYGRHVGVDPNTGEVVEEISEVSYYSGPDAEPEYVVITDMEGNWDVKVIGRGTGMYILATEVVGLGEGAQIDHVTKPTNPGQVDDYQLTYPTTPGEPIPLIPKTVSLRPDWNLLSLPLVPTDTSIKTVLSSISGSYDLVYAYDGCNVADPWKKYDVNAPPYANDLTDLDEKMGIWIRGTDTSTLSVSGRVPTGTDIQLCEGWNLMGYPSTKTKAITDALSSIDGKYTPVYAYDALDTADPWKKYDVSAPPYANDLTEMHSGLAYWIKVSEDCVLTVSN